MRLRCGLENKADTVVLDIETWSFLYITCEGIKKVNIYQILSIHNVLKEWLNLRSSPLPWIQHWSTLFLILLFVGLKLENKFTDAAAAFWNVVSHYKHNVTGVTCPFIEKYNGRMTTAITTDICKVKCMKSRKCVKTSRVLWYMCGFHNWLSRNLEAIPLFDISYAGLSHWGRLMHFCVGA